MSPSPRHQNRKFAKPQRAEHPYKPKTQNRKALNFINPTTENPYEPPKKPTTQQIPKSTG